MHFLVKKVKTYIISKNRCWKPSLLIRVKDKVEVLRKHLKGEAKEMIGYHYETLDKAFEALLKHLSLAKKTWEYKLKQFSKCCNRPNDWAAVGTPQGIILSKNRGS